jgi:hypothetical protein
MAVLQALVTVPGEGVPRHKVYVRKAGDQQRAAWPRAVHALRLPTVPATPRRFSGNRTSPRSFLLNHTSLSVPVPLGRRIRPPLLPLLRLLFLLLLVLATSLIDIALLWHFRLS